MNHRQPFMLYFFFARLPICFTNASFVNLSCNIGLFFKAIAKGDLIRRLHVFDNSKPSKFFTPYITGIK